MAIAGRVAMIPKGDYDATVTYQILDVVRYNDASYVAKKSSTGILPTDTEFWMLMTSDGIVIDSALSDSSTNAVQNKVLKSALDSIQTTSRATLSQAGWYRVAEYTSADQNIRMGAQTNSVEIMLRRVYDATPSETVRLLFDADINRKWFSLVSHTGVALFTKVRFTYDSKAAYIEVYYDYNAPNRAIASIGQHDKDFYNSAWKAIDFIATSETVSGVTVTTTYDIPANASPVNNIDLTTALAGYLPKTGGAVEGSLTVGTINDTDNRTLYLFNNARRIMLRVNSNGSFDFYDITHDKSIINSIPEGTNTFNGTATGNLPLSGGKISGGISNTALQLAPTVANGQPVLIEYDAQDTLYGHIGFNGVDKPIIRTSTGAYKDILHTGNSNPTVQSTTAPSDTTAIWIDTANKKLKAYIDGAWTVIA